MGLTRLAFKILKFDKRKHALGVRLFVTLPGACRMEFCEKAP